MKIQIFHYRHDYLPFCLYIESIKSIIYENITQYIEVISDCSQIYDERNTIFIMFMIDLQNNIHHINELKNIKTIIFINTEHYTNAYLHINLNIINSPKYHIWDFSPRNISAFNTYYPYIQTHYLPLLYNTFLTNYYNSQITQKINYSSKTIDILFFGTMNERRRNILNKLQYKYVVKIISIEDRLTDSQLFDFIENSKLVLNIFYYEEFVFDYYRSAILIANKINTIYETPHNIDTNIETNLLNWETNIQHSNYDNLISSVDNMLKKSEIDIQTITQNTYNWFSTNDMKTYIIEFMNNILK